MILTKEDIQGFANLTGEELETIDYVKKALKLRPAGKLQIQGSAMEFDELAIKINDILFGLQYQLAGEELEKDKTLSKYFHDKLSLYKEKELLYKFMNENTEDSTFYKMQILKVSRLKFFIEALERILWTIKSRNETLRIAHNTDY